MRWKITLASGVLVAATALATTGCTNKIQPVMIVPSPDLTLVFENPDLAPTDDGGMPDLIDTATDDAGDTNPCLARASLIYTIDQNNTLASFDPKTLKFKDIGVLNCPQKLGGTPFSMGVDALANAWVLYSSGEIFDVDTSNAKCMATKWMPNMMGFSTFGMGFVSDAPGSLKEHLFIAGLGNRELGVVDTRLLNLKVVGNLNGNPELTGNGNAQLWGFFPEAQMPRVAQLDKAKATEGKTFKLAMLAGNPTAWAFAFWGGDFWIFLKKDAEPSTHVYHLVAASGKVSDVLPNSNRTIVGAGVSICAPVMPPTH